MSIFIVYEIKTDVFEVFIMVEGKITMDSPSVILHCLQELYRIKTVYLLQKVLWKINHVYGTCPITKLNTRPHITMKAFHITSFILKMRA